LLGDSEERHCVEEKPGPNGIQVRYIT